jgi:choline dehydrogenase-like flavoprotein
MDAGPLDYLVIGAGPAGLQLAQQLGAAGHDYLVLESGKAPGTFFARFPRHRQLISVNKPHTGTGDAEIDLRMDWNSLLSPDGDLLFTRYSERYFPGADDPAAARPVPAPPVALGADRPAGPDVLHLLRAEHAVRAAHEPAGAAVLGRGDRRGRAQ